MSENQQQIADAKIERDRLSEECFQLLYRISRKPSCLKLLRLAKAHLEMLSNYKRRITNNINNNYDNDNNTNRSV